MSRSLIPRALLTAATLWVGGACVNAQTPLFPGDLAIVGINANNSCITTTADEISFICFKNITTNTQIDITDNGYERQFAGQWGKVRASTDSSARGR